MNKLFACILFFVPAVIFSQTFHDGLEFSRTEFKFPKAENWVSRIDSIEITNTTDKKIHLLKLNDPRGFELRYPNRGIEPGKTEIIEIIFMPKEKGRFNFTFPVYHSVSQTPVTISYKGEILNFDEFAEAACPSFTKPNLKPVSFEMEITVLDSSTKKPLGHSFLEIASGELFSQHSTNTKGIYKQPAGIKYYFIEAEHAGYQSRSVAKHINPKNRKITLELPPLLPPSVPASTPSVSVTTDTPSVSNPAPTVATTVTPFPLAEYKRNNIVFLIDRSSSMNQPDCMPLLQTAMIQLTGMTRPEDRITIITYSNEAKIILPGIAGNEHGKIISVINQLKCGGRTEGGKAIHIAYENAEENFIPGGINQVIIATDGGFNGLSENEAELMQLVDAKSKEGIKLAVLAFGQNRYGKAHITRLAKQGEGFYLFIANAEEAQAKLTETIQNESRIK